MPQADPANPAADVPAVPPVNYRDTAAGPQLMPQTSAAREPDAPPAPPLGAASRGIWTVKTLICTALTSGPDVDVFTYLCLHVFTSL